MQIFVLHRHTQQKKAIFFFPVACGKFHYQKENLSQYVSGRDPEVLTVSVSRWQNNKEAHLYKVTCQHLLRKFPVCVCLYASLVPFSEDVDIPSRIPNICWHPKSSTWCFGICLSDQMAALDGLWSDVQIKRCSYWSQELITDFTSSGETTGERVEAEGGRKRKRLSNGPLSRLIFSWWCEETRRIEGAEGGALDEVQARGWVRRCEATEASSDCVCI